MMKALGAADWRPAYYETLVTIAVAVAVALAVRSLIDRNTTATTKTTSKKKERR